MKNNSIIVIYYESLTIYSKKLVLYELTYVIEFIRICIIDFIKKLKVFNNTVSQSIIFENAKVKSFVL